MNIDDNLASLLQDYPAIWDKRNAGFKDNSKKEYAFKELASILNTTVDVVAARYKALREKYRKEKLKLDVSTRNGSGHMHYRQWHLMPSLKFLDDVQTKRKTVASITKSIMEKSSTAMAMPTVKQEHDDDDEYADSDMLDMPESPTQLSPMMVPTAYESRTSSSENLHLPDAIMENKGAKDGQDDITAIMARLAAAAETTAAKVRHVKPAIDNEVNTFTKYVEQCLHNISEEYVDDAIRDIYNVLYKYKKLHKK
ncbi:PREDICTED: uncharacterized protein LOC108565387 [Nicrophorus vespilloides]|uniref:Uncharacterized protein LOC108565387 n=1 Tax=Nicrophorus vespilloides TaxID=110193 RepID=A0ABM1N0F6_NICVS|nr:PREDICTED: uncharacterized protein LOC108565387 [Nicrophorus vespilloides]